MSKDNYKFRLTVEGICPCGGKLRTAEWETKSHKKGRTTCVACGRTELKEMENNGNQQNNRKLHSNPL